MNAHHRRRQQQPANAQPPRVYIVARSYDEAQQCATVNSLKPGQWVYVYHVDLIARANGQLWKVGGWRKRSDAPRIEQAAAERAKSPGLTVRRSTALAPLVIAQHTLRH